MLKDVEKGAGREPVDLLQRVKQTRVARRMYCLIIVRVGWPRAEEDKALDHILVWHSRPFVCSHTLASVCWLFSPATALSLSSRTQRSVLRSATKSSFCLNFRSRNRLHWPWFVRCQSHSSPGLWSEFGKHWLAQPKSHALPLESMEQS